MRLRREVLLPFFYKVICGVVFKTDDMRVNDMLYTTRPKLKEAILCSSFLMKQGQAIGRP